jgi:hypothetical protein
MQQRPALAGWFFALMGTITAAGAASGGRLERRRSKESQ